MLKIRIAGSESELRQIAHKAGNTSIKRFKRNNGKTTFAIDVQISVEDFLDNLNLSSHEPSSENSHELSSENSHELSSENSHELSSDNSHELSSDNKTKNCNPQEIQAELESLLNEISDK